MHFQQQIFTRLYPLQKLSTKTDFFSHQSAVLNCRHMTSLLFMVISERAIQFFILEINILFYSCIVQLPSVLMRLKSHNKSRTTSRLILLVSFLFNYNNPSYSMQYTVLSRYFMHTVRSIYTLHIRKC